MIPDQITINGVPFKVEQIEDLTLEGKPHFGVYDPRNFRIQVDAALPSERQRVTLLHEVLHAVADDRNLELGEHTVDQLAKGLYAVLASNPGLVSGTAKNVRKRQSGAKLSDSEVCQMRRLANDGASSISLGKQFGVSQSAAYAVIRGWTYKTAGCERA